MSMGESDGGYSVYYPSNIFHNTRSVEKWGTYSDIPQFQTQLIEGNGYETRHSSLLYFFVRIFGLDRAQELTN